MSSSITRVIVITQRYNPRLLENCKVHAWIQTSINYKSYEIWSGLQMSKFGRIRIAPKQQIEIEVLSSDSGTKYSSNGAKLWINPARLQANPMNLSTNTSLREKYLCSSPSYRP